MFSIMARLWFNAPIHGIYCGLRGFRKEFQQSLGQRCTGMEFATEMIIKSSLLSAKIAEVPITLHPDGRKAHAPQRLHEQLVPALARRPKKPGLIPPPQGSGAS